MKLERSNVEFPIWRKKVDKSLFHYNGTTVPEWACVMWGLPSLYADVSTKKDPRAQATVEYNGRTYDGWVTVARHGRTSPAFRFWYDPALTLELKRAFVMSYMRTLEGELHKDGDAEKTIPFWEFLDVEFDREKRKFILRSYFTQTPSFPHLFARLVGSPALRKVEDEVKNKGDGRIHKQDWKPRGEIEFELGAQNVLYTLIDSASKLVYIGEAADLVKRLMQPHPSIPHWDWFRYNVLPNELSQYRVAIERMIIRDFAAFCPNKKGHSWRDIAGYSLTNDKVDK